MAGTFCVDPGATGAGTGDCTDGDWTDAYTSLKTAFTNASSGDAIWVKTGTYTPGTSRTSTFQMKDGVDVYGGFEGNEDPDTFNLADRDFAANPTVLSCEIGGGQFSDNCYHVVTGSRTGREITGHFTLDGFTVSSANADATTFPHKQGGGFTTYTLNAQSAGTGTVANCIFTNNKATHAVGFYVLRAGVDFVDCLFDSNEAFGNGFTGSGGAGGSVSVQYSTNVSSFTNCVFSNNRSTGGSTYGNGAGVALTANDTEFENCLFHDNNTAGGGGGAVFVAATVSGNASPAFTNCTFADNDAGTGNGGGFYINESASFDIDVTITNCILWGNTDVGGTDESAQIHDGGATPAVIDVTYTIIDGCLTSFGGFCETPTTNLGDDPLFVDDSGDNYHLVTGSPGIDAGDNTASTETYDLDGLTRIANGGGGLTVDIGPYEMQSVGCNAPTIVYVDVDATGAENGTSWTDAFTNLQDALTLARNAWNCIEGGEQLVEQIWVAAGSYYPDEGAGYTPGTRTDAFKMVPGVKMYGGFDPGSGIDLFNERLPDTYKTVLSGDLEGDDGNLLPNGINDFDEALACFTGPGGTATGACLVYDVEPAMGGDNDVDQDDLSIGDNSYHIVKGNVVSDAIADSLTAADLIDGFIIRHAFALAGFSKKGGGFYNKRTPDAPSDGPTINDCDFIENLAMDNGGGLYSEREITITNCKFTDNRTGAAAPVKLTHGGAIALEGVDPNLATITDCTFTDNVAEARGGAIHYDGDGDLNVTDCTFTGGESRGAVNDCGGGGIWVGGPAGLTATIVDCTFTSNLSVFTANNTGAGGAIYLSGSGPNSITGCTFTTNEAAGTGGGAVYIDSFGKLTITDCTFDTNDASGGDGGGIYATGLAEVDVVACTFDTNTADGNGGGVYFDGVDATGEDMTLTNCLFVQNAADGTDSDGGAIYVFDSTNSLQTLIAINCTIVENTADREGGGVFVHADGDFDATNCIFWENTDVDYDPETTTNETSQIHDDTSAADVTYCDIEDCAAGGFCSSPGDENFLDAPGFNDAGNGDYSLVVDALAANRGSNSAVPSGVTEDLAGGDRIRDLNTTGPCNHLVDCGAYEYQGEDCP